MSHADPQPPRNRKRLVPVAAAQLVVIAVALWIAIGVVVAILFLWRGAGRIDDAARNSTWGFRILVLPGLIALWPLVLRWTLRKDAAP